MGSRGSSMYYSSGKRQHYATLLLLALGAAMLSLLVVHKLREGRVLGLLLHDREQQLLTLQMILQKERVHSMEMKAKTEELKTKAASLRSQKVQLKTRLMEAENQAAYLENKRAELESALEEKQTKLASLQAMEEASEKANSRVAALTHLLKQQRDHADEMERRLQPPSTQPASDVSKRNETDESSSREETVDGAEEAQGSKAGEWVRLQTNADDDAGDLADDGKSAEEEGRAKESTSEEGRHSDEQVQVDAQNAGDENQINENRGTDGEVPAMEEEATNSNTTETRSTVVAPGEEGKVEEKDGNAAGEEKQMADQSETKITKRRSRRNRGRKRRAGARSVEQSTESSKMETFGNAAAEMSTGELAPAKLPEDHQTAAAGAAEKESQGNTTVGSNGDESSKTLSSVESYQDTNGSEEKSSDGDGDGDDKDGNSGDGGSDMSDGGENGEEKNVRSTLERSEESEASHGGRAENPNDGTGEGEISEAEGEGNERAGSEKVIRERDGGDEEKEAINVSTEAIRREGTATEEAEGGDAINEDSAQEKPGDGSRPEEEEEGEAGNQGSEQEDEKEDDVIKEDAEEF